LNGRADVAYFDKASILSVRSELPDEDVHVHTLYQAVGGPEQHLVELTAEEGDHFDR